MIRVFDLPTEEDLLPFSAFLWQQGIPHKISEEGSRQVLWLEQAEHREPVQMFYRDWQAGLLSLDKVKLSWRGGSGLMSGPLADWKSMPVTLILLLACTLVAVLTRLGGNHDMVALLTMTDFQVRAGSLYYAPWTLMLEQGQFWRIVSPILLHFGVFHFLFNMLWLLDFGHRIELRHKGLFLLVLVLLTGVVSNGVQFVTMDGYPLFGGMSGVIYGLLGFCWVREQAEPGCYRVPSGIYMFMLIWLVVGFTGVLGSFGFGKIANAAHTGGLLSGVAMGWLYNRLVIKQ